MNKKQCLLPKAVGNREGEFWITVGINDHSFTNPNVGYNSDTTLGFGSLTPRTKFFYKGDTTGDIYQYTGVINSIVTSYSNSYPDSTSRVFIDLNSALKLDNPYAERLVFYLHVRVAETIYSSNFSEYGLVINLESKKATLLGKALSNLVGTTIPIYIGPSETPPSWL